MDESRTDRNLVVALPSAALPSARAVSSMSEHRSSRSSENITYLAKEEVYAILETCSAKEKASYLLMSFLWKTGLRISEAIAIKKGDINFYDKTATVRWLKKRRQAVRSIPLEEDLAYQLSVYCSALNLEERLFPFSRVRAFQIIKEHAKRAMLSKKVSPHTFRHSFAIHFLKETRDLPALQKLLGHAQITTTMVYLRLSHADLRRELQNAHF